MSRSQFLLSLFLILFVYLLGAFLPLMENDSAQHATMVMRMVNTQDFLSLFRGWEPYLDKPHLHFWLSAFSMSVFGITEWAYRLPAIVVTLAGAFAVYSLAKHLYSKELGRLAAVVFLSSQTIVLANHDVRTDAVLTGFVALALWQLIVFVDQKKLKNAALGGLFLAMAFSTKGLLALLMTGIPVVGFLIAKKHWKVLGHPGIILGAVSFAIGISPILYAYHSQFGTEGVRFILIDQSFNRLNAEGFEKNNKQDPFFFFHTLLWTFLPWSLLFYFGFIQSIFVSVKKIWAKSTSLSKGTFWAFSILVVLLIINTSSFKLPHYINGLIPAVSVFTALVIHEIQQKTKTQRAFVFVYLGLFVLILIALLLLNFYAFSMHLILLILFAFLISIFGLAIFKNIKNKSNFGLIIIPFSIFFLANFYLNSSFYPQLLNYQGGIHLADFSKENPDKEIYRLQPIEAWTLDFKQKKLLPVIEQEKLNQLPKNTALLIDHRQKKTLEDEQIKLNILQAQQDYHVSKLKLNFLNKKERAEVLDSLYLVELD